MPVTDSTTSSEANPDHQMPMPFQAAQDYAETVMRWARELDDAQLQVQRRVAYGPDRLHYYNVFSPPGARGAPVLVFWHGGGWTNGYPDFNTFMAPIVVRLGCVLVTPAYRLAPDHPLPAAFDDSLRALAHISENIGQFGGAGGRLLLGGHSAGAHLAALVALRPADRARAGLPTGAVRACLPISGVMDLHHPAPEPGSLEERVYSMVLTDSAQDAVMSPICWTSGNRVPFHVSCGAQDSERVRRSNTRMVELLKLQGAPVSFSMLPGLDHFQNHTALRDGNHPWYQRLAQQMQEFAP